MFTCRNTQHKCRYLSIYNRIVLIYMEITTTDFTHFILITNVHKKWLWVCQHGLINGSHLLYKHKGEWQAAVDGTQPWDTVCEQLIFKQQRKSWSVKQFITPEYLCVVTNVPYQPMEAVNRRQLKTNGDELTVLEGIQNFLPMSVFLFTFFFQFSFRYIQESYQQR